MAKLVAVDRERHAGKGWRQPTGYGFAATQAVTPLMGAEFAKAALAMPIGFIEQVGHYIAVAVMSVVPDRNLFIGPGGQWLGAYAPAVLRGYPFQLLRAEGSDKLVLCIDEDSGLIVDADADAQKFFEADGGLSAAVTATVNLLQQIEHNRAFTDLAVAALAEVGLIAPWPLTVAVDGQSHAVNGLHRIDEAKLNALDDEAFLKLRKSGALPLAYLQLLSMGQVSLFAQLSRLQQQLAPAPVHTKVLSLDEIFAQAGNETIQFN
jgi:hypothetical protein